MQVALPVPCLDNFDPKCLMQTYRPHPFFSRPTPSRFTSSTPLFTTLTIAGAVAIGSNMVDVQNRAMTIPQAVCNGLAKGAAATLILSVTTRSTPLQVTLAAVVLAGAGYLIDSAMKTKIRRPSVVPEDNRQP